jgi:hypothetical protein
VVTREPDTDNEYLGIVDCNSRVTLLRDHAGSAQRIYKTGNPETVKYSREFCGTSAQE